MTAGDAGTLQLRLRTLEELTCSVPQGLADKVQAVAFV